MNPLEPKSNGKHDVLTHRILVMGLSGCVILTTAAIGYLAVIGQEVPPSLPALGGTALGALTGMLAAIMRER